MLTLIAHIKNEELLLPHWVRHHVNMVDAATIIDYASTDASLDVLRELAPSWTIVRSQNSDFDALDCDHEVMQIEASMSGWKTVLNVTEFLVAPELRSTLQMAEQAGLHGITGSAFLIVDRERLGLAGVVETQPLLPQLTYGYPCFKGETPYWFTKERLIHRWKTGGYMPGRHSWLRGPTAYSPDILFAWLAYAPWDDAMIARKVAIGNEVSVHDRIRGYGSHHHRSAAELEAVFQKESGRAQDLRLDHLWRRLVNPAG